LSRYQTELAGIASDLRSLRYEVGDEPDDDEDGARPALPATTVDGRAHAEATGPTNGARPALGSGAETTQRG
jgi:hypothetical protein